MPAGGSRARRPRGMREQSNRMDKITLPPARPIGRDELRVY